MLCPMGNRVFKSIYYILILIMLSNVISAADQVSNEEKSKAVSLFCGGNFSFLVNDDYSESSDKHLLNFDIGALFSYNFYSRIFIESGIEYDYNTFEHQKYNLRYDDSYLEHLYMSYLYLPIYLKIDLVQFERFSIYTSFGYKFGILVKSIANFEYSSGYKSGLSIYDESKPFSNSYQQNLGFAYKIAKLKEKVQFGIFMELAYKHTFTNTIVNENFSINSYKVLLGLKGSWK